MLRDEEGELQYLLTDHLGSVVAITDDTGTLTSQQRYLPFGGARTNIASLPIIQTDYWYTGQRDLGDMGLIDYKFRFYSDTLGRFISPESITAGGPQGLNRYSYVGNQPINFSDPTGHIRIEEYGGKKGCTNPVYCEKGKPKPLPKRNVFEGVRAGSGANYSPQWFPPIPPFNVTLPTLFPINVVGDDLSYYMDPFAVKVTTQPSFTFNNGSPITLGPGRPAGTFTERDGNIATRFTINSDMSSSYGLVTFNQVDEIATQTFGVGIPTYMAPQELSITFTASTAINIPTPGGTTLGVSMNIPATISMRYNPHGLVGILVADAAALWAIAPEAFSLVGTKLIQQTAE